MKIETIRSLLLWCAVINYGILLIWFLAFTAAHDFIYGLHGRWFRLSVEQFDALHYGGMAIFKIGVLLLRVSSNNRGKSPIGFLTICSIY